MIIDHTDEVKALKVLREKYKVYLAHIEKQIEVIENEHGKSNGMVE